MALKKIKKKHDGGALTLPAFVTETLDLKKGEPLWMWNGRDYSLMIGKEKEEAYAIGRIRPLKPSGCVSLQIPIPKLWMDHHGVKVGDHVDIEVSVDCFEIKAVKNG